MIFHTILEQMSPAVVRVMVQTQRKLSAFIEVSDLTTDLHTKKAYMHTGTSSPQILLLSAHA